MQLGKHGGTGVNAVLLFVCSFEGGDNSMARPWRVRLWTHLLFCIVLLVFFLFPVFVISCAFGRALLAADDQNLSSLSFRFGFQQGRLETRF